MIAMMFGFTDGSFAGAAASGSAVTAGRDSCEAACGSAAGADSCTTVSSGEESAGTAVGCKPSCVFCRLVRPGVSAGKDAGGWSTVTGQ